MDHGSAWLELRLTVFLFIPSSQPAQVSYLMHEVWSVLEKCLQVG